jgi:hypothetical protein
MITIAQGIKLSAIVDKMDIKITNPTGSQAEVGADLMMQIVKKAHKAEGELYAFVAEVKKISVEEAKQADLLEFIKELTSSPELMGFFGDAVKSKGQG